MRSNRTRAGDAGFGDFRQVSMFSSWSKNMSFFLPHFEISQPHPCVARAAHSTAVTMLRHGLTTLARRPVLTVRARRRRVAPDRAWRAPAGHLRRRCTPVHAGARGSRRITCHPPQRAPRTDLPPRPGTHLVRSFRRRRRRRVKECGRHVSCALRQIPRSQPGSQVRYQTAQYLHAAALLHGKPRAS